MTETSTRKNDPLGQLAWQVEMGADEVISETPVNRFEKAIEEEPEARGTASEPARPEIPQGAPPPPDVAEQAAGDLAAKAKTLEALKKAIETFDGCSLKKTAMSTVFARGNPASGLMLVGEAPGADEDRQGKPFVGAAGKLLDKMMAAIGRTSEEDYYISNILPWRPPGNRKPTLAEQAMCLPFIRRHIELAGPKVLVLLGGTALQALMETSDGITRVRGMWLSLTINGGEVPVMATFHPAYLLRQPQLKRQAWQDLLEIKSKLDG